MKNTIVGTNMDALKHEVEIPSKDTPNNSEENDSGPAKRESHCTSNCTLLIDPTPTVSVLKSELCEDNIQIVIKSELDTQVVIKYEEDTVNKCEPDSSSTSTSQKLSFSENEEEGIRESIVNLIEDVFHAFICRNVSCTRNNCRKMKWILLHSKSCRGRLSNHQCVSCKHLFMLLTYHAHICEESAPLSLKCKLLRCSNFKIYLKKIKSIQQQMSKVHNLENQNSSAIVNISTSSTSMSTSLSISEPSMFINSHDSIIINLETDSIVNPDEDKRQRHM